MLISLQDIGVSFAGTTILEHITADVQENSRIGLIGANGAGKSTLLNMITGELENEWGEITRKPGTPHRLPPPEQRSGPAGTPSAGRCVQSSQKVLDAKQKLDDLQIDMGQFDPRFGRIQRKGRRLRYAALIFRGKRRVYDRRQDPVGPKRHGLRRPGPRHQHLDPLRR